MSTVPTPLVLIVFFPFSLYPSSDVCNDFGYNPAVVLQIPLGSCFEGRIFECARECDVLRVYVMLYCARQHMFLSVSERSCLSDI